MAASEGGGPRHRSSGGIVRGGARSGPRVPGSLPEAMTGLRRRWSTGIAIVTTVDDAAGLRGITVTSLMFVSNDPPVIAFALTLDGAFQGYLHAGSPVGVSILESHHEFSAERFAGRAPIPDGRFTGVAHAVESGVPVLAGALAWCTGNLRSREAVGDHVLVLVDVEAAGLGEDTDDPLLSYEGRYRRLEAG